MKKPDKWVLYAAYAVVVAGLSLWQYHRYRASFETVQPYTHPGPAVERTVIPDEEEADSGSSSRKKHSAMDPTSEDTTGTDTTEPTTEPPTEISFPIDLNTADAAALAQIPGIGEVTAAAITAYRDEHGGFRNREELLQIHGIGEKRYAELLDYLYLTDEQPLPTEETETVKPTQGDPQEKPAKPAPEPEPEPTEPPVINLNTATKEQLMLLPGCTEELADAILKMRDELIHTFRTVLEITMAEGMTTSLYCAWDPYLAVDDAGNKELPQPEP